MLSQFAIQYGINTCCLRAPWIMEKDDFRYSLSFGDDVFGGPVWNSLVAHEVAKRCQAEGTVPLLRDARGNPLKRNFVHVEDLARPEPPRVASPTCRRASETAAWPVRRLDSPFPKWFTRKIHCRGA